MNYGQEKKALTDKISEFLFRRPKKDVNGEESQFLDTSTVIMNKADYNAIVYYRILQEAYKCKAAGIIADILERCNISTVRSSDCWNARLEGVSILHQKDLPKKEILTRGIAESLKELEET